MLLLFNSIQFFIFFIIVYALYLVLPFRWQNRLLLIASYLFYASWDWRFLSLLILTTIVDYSCAIFMEKYNRKVYLFVSIFSNLSVLFTFKYFDFFITSLQNLGLNLNPVMLNFILPVGISFYTFQSLSYTIEVYRGNIKASRDFLNFALFVSFFPQLVAGPIERAHRLLPQVSGPRKVTLDLFYRGAYLIFLGLFLKIFLADNLADYVDHFFTLNPHHGIYTLIIAYAFAFQIFGDFAGYSFIAKGLAAMMGFELMNNFNSPYFSKNISEFWRRWHISLSTWFRDYIYIPLGGNKIHNLRNLFITMFLAGLWHGANYTFVVWGMFHGLMLIVNRIYHNFKLQINRFMIIRNVISVIFTFHLVCLGWILFRSPDIAYAFNLIINMFSHTLTLGQWRNTIKIIFFISLPLLITFYQYYKDDIFALQKSNVLIRASVYALMFMLMFIFGDTDGKGFIYFQF